MRFVWINFRKDWQRVRRDPVSLATSIAIPVVLAVLMSLVFGGGEARPQGRLLVDDEDGSILSNLLLGAFQRDPLGKMITVDKVGLKAGRDRIDSGDGSAFLIVPKGFQDAFLNNRPVKLQLFTNPAQNVLPQIVQETLSLMVDGGFYVQRVAGNQLRAIDTGGAAPPDAAVASLSVSFNHLASSLQRYLNPPVIGLQTTVVQEQRQTENFAAAFLPSMIFMGLLLVASSLALDIWRERMQGTLRRLAGSSMPLAAFLAGRVLFVASVFALMSSIGLATARGLAGMPVPRPAAAALWMIFTGAAFYLLLLVVTLLPSTPRAANVLGNLLTFPLAMIGGCFFPFEWMPDWMARIGRLTPNGWAITQFKAILAGSIDAPRLSLAVAGLLAVSALAFLYALRRLRGAFVS
jgi:ABC-2 type transport system permease protein